MIRAFRVPNDTADPCRVCRQRRAGNAVILEKGYLLGDTILTLCMTCTADLISAASQPLDGYKRRGNMGREDRRHGGR